MGIHLQCDIYDLAIKVEWIDKKKKDVNMSFLFIN